MDQLELTKFISMKNIDKLYMDIALRISEQSWCERNKVGAVIVMDNNILSFGYNGTPRGFTNSCETKDGVTRVEVLHAESNAILKCAKAGRSTEGATLYITLAPCVECAKLIIQSGISNVLYMEDYRDSSGVELLIRAGISVEKFS